MDENMDLNDVCRLCLSKKDKTLHIFSQNDPGEDALTTKIRACVGVEVRSHIFYFASLCNTLQDSIFISI